MAEILEQGMPANADQIRAFCIENYVNPARLNGDYSVTLKAGAVRDALRENRFGDTGLPAICAALGANAFIGLGGLRRIHVEGPLNGANTYLTFLILANIEN